LKCKFEVVAGCALHVSLNVRTACVMSQSPVSVVERLPHLRPLFFCLLWTVQNCAVGNTFISHSCHVRRFVELRNIEMPPRSSQNLLVLMHLSAARKDLTDLSACGIMKFL